MRYLYYPGCSLKCTARGYEESLLAVFSALGCTLEEIQDWNCCGATAYMSVDEMKAFALAARNLALAEGHGDLEPSVTVVAPCSACYLVLTKAHRYMQEYGEVGQTIRRALSKAGLEYQGRVVIRHPLDILVNDIGLEKIGQVLQNRFRSLKVASYYGCQMIRPWATFDEQYNPCSMDHLVQTVGGLPVEWSLKTRCCGGSLTGTVEEVGLRLCHILLKEAERQGAELIVTSCPLCQFNLECFQDQIHRRFNGGVYLPVIYFTQLLGAAL
ncbi:MAG: CoB--CoM heterodisulfide reductase iron-sulfur subunit B family protein, partial [Candidatus Zixiibacteriota bacterium]